jgi:uncharacterized protein YecT (DUF1311 family)
LEVPDIVPDVRLRGLGILILFPILCLAAEEKEPTLAEAKAAFAKADSVLNEAWTAAKKTLTANVLEELTIKQRAWVLFRERRALLETREEDEAKAKQVPGYFTIAAELTDDRVKWLRGRSKGDDDSLTGLWIDSYGGTMELVEQDGRLLFLFNVVRGHSFDVGAIAGVAVWNTKIGWFADKGRDPDKADETNLAFIRRDSELEVAGANTSYYHGRQAYFDGGYCKVAPLDEKQKSVVIAAAESGKVPED